MLHMHFNVLSRSFASGLLFGLLSLGSLFSSTASAQSRGESLFLENCAICHGENGAGGMGATLSSHTFLDSASNQYLKQTIRLGRPGRIMPSFYFLPEPDVDAIIEYISQWRKSPPREWAKTPVKGNAENGQSLFQAHCASCHGKEAEGGIGTGMHFSRPTSTPVTAPALNNQGLLNSMPDHMIRYMIEQKRENSIMPSASQLGLSREQVNNIVSFIRGFQVKTLSKKALYDDEPASLIYDSPYSFEETVENVKRAITGTNFVHIRDQELTEGFTIDKNNGSKQTMIYFCNFNFLYEALKIDPRVGMFLPCRITITEENDAVKMMSINPKHLSQLFNNNELDESCDKMYELYTNILEDASL